MANKKYHHLLKRDGIWYFRMGGAKWSLKTTQAAEAIRLRDEFLNNYRRHGVFQLVEAFIAELECGPKRINNILVPMRSVFDFAYKSGTPPAGKSCAASACGLKKCPKNVPPKAKGLRTLSVSP